MRGGDSKEALKGVVGRLGHGLPLKMGVPHVGKEETPLMVNKRRTDLIGHMHPPPHRKHVSSSTAPLMVNKRRTDLVVACDLGEVCDPQSERGEGGGREGGGGRLTPQR